MTFEVHATAAGVGHPPAEQAPGTLATLAETIVIKEENVFVVSRRDGSLPVGAPHPLGLYTRTAASSRAMSCTSTASRRGSWSPRRRPARSRSTS
jgi:hypothetical protein